MEELKLGLTYKSYFLTSITMFVLCPIDINVFVKKKSCQSDLIGFGGPSSLKIIFALPTKMVVIHMHFIIIYIWNLSFKKLFALC